MSKALEALEKIRNVLGKELGIWNCQEFADIIQALTPPTEEEVCKVLEDLFWAKVSYNKRRKLFATETKKCVQLIEGRIKTYYDYSPEVSIMLGQFYEMR